MPLQNWMFNFKAAPAWLTTIWILHLCFAADALSQFRFQSERDWELDGQGSDTAAESGLLALNLADLANSLNCVPLHTRLGLEEEHFGVG